MLSTLKMQVLITIVPVGVLFLLLRIIPVDKVLEGPSSHYCI